MVWILRGLLMLVIGIGVYYWYVRQQKRQTLVDPLSLIRQSAVDVDVARLADGNYQIRWFVDADLKQIQMSYDADQPDDAETLTIKEQGEDYVIVTPASAVKPIYFHLMFDNRQTMVVSERILTFDGIKNFRDIGGYRTGDGQYVRWGRVFRSGDTGGGSPADLENLNQMGVQFICDLRSDLEVASRPDQTPISAHLNLHLPIVANIGQLERYRLLFMNRDQLEKLVFKLYTAIILEKNAHIMGDVLRRLADPQNLPALIHCTAGKDRTGVLIALLLSVLGVPDHVIVADYTLSNHYYDNFYDFTERSTQKMAFLGFTPKDVQPLILARSENMQYLLAYIQQHYGSVEIYLKEKSGIDETVIEQLKLNLLQRDK